MTAETAPALVQHIWFKSSYSGGNETECVEAAFSASGTGIRDSKRPAGPHLRFAAPAWHAFTTALRQDRLPRA